MVKSTLKDIDSKKNILGQFFTQPNTIVKLLKDIDLNKFDTIIEPSFGSGNFIQYVIDNYQNKEIIGLEIDEDVFQEIEGVKTFNQNFYDFELSSLKNKKIAFIGNPPYRTPAYSLKTHPLFVKNLLKKYDVKGIKEESVIFLIHTFDILNKFEDFEIHYILPKVIFQNQSESYKSFRKFLEKHLNLYKVQNLKKEFEGVDQDLVFVSFKKGIQEEKVLLDSKETEIENFYGQTDEYWDYRKIFKKTYLGSVPAESIFLSIKDEPEEHFKNRLKLLFESDLSIGNIKKYSQYKGKFHLKVFNGTNIGAIEAKWKVIQSYLTEIKHKKIINIVDIENKDNYKRIQHRKEERFYFRNEKLKSVSFVYILNPNPGKSFYFTSNPSKTSTDYFGFCDFDVNRNSSPGSMRTVLLENFDDNITDEFKEYWENETNDLPLIKICDYILFISKSKWYKDIKNKYYRIYFGLPKKFDKIFLKEIK